MFLVEYKYWDEWKTLYKFSTIGAAIQRYMSLIGKGETCRIIYRDNESVLHVPYVQSK